jgi:hypothetical protein
MLDKDRAQQIADYIDSGFGSIPTSIVLSAQPDAALRIIGKGKTVEFKSTRKAFLILDGQHRVYGFSLAKTRLRMPVVIYNGLSKRDKSRLFIDINTKQRPVPNELLLDIKKLAEYESDAEALFGEVFDLFDNEPGSPLFGLMSPTIIVTNLVSGIHNIVLRSRLLILSRLCGCGMSRKNCSFFDSGTRSQSISGFGQTVAFAQAQDHRISDQSASYE